MPLQRLSAFVALTALGCASVLACAGPRPRPPEPGESRGFVPELRGQRVMVLPFQLREGLAGDPDDEFAFALQGTASSVEWILPDEIRAQMRASPALDAPLDGLPVEVFLRTEVDRLGDPIFGVLRRLSAVTGADLVLLPVAVFPETVVEDEGGGARIRASAALMSARTGRVLWYGVEAGPGHGGDPAALATVMDALARRLAPRSVGRTPPVDRRP